MPSLVGSVQNHSTSSPLVLSYNTSGGGTTGGNCLVACIGAFATGSGAVVGNVSFSTISDNWQTSGAGGSKSTIWIDPDCAGSQQQIEIFASTTGSNLQISAFIFEFSGLDDSPIDKFTSAGVLGSFSSGLTSLTSEGNEIWVGIGSGNSSASFTTAGPGSPWSNLAAIPNSSGSLFSRCIAGWQLAASAGQAGYAGTFSPSSGQDGNAAVLTLKPAAGRTRSRIITPGAQAVHRSYTW